MNEAVENVLRERLLLLADCFLSVSALSSAALPALLDQSELIQQGLKLRLSENLEMIRRRSQGGAHFSLISRPAGWNAVLAFPSLSYTPSWAELLLEEERTIAQPGHFYELARDQLVISLLTPPPVLMEGLDRMERCIQRQLV